MVRSDLQADPDSVTIVAATVMVVAPVVVMRVMVVPPRVFVEGNAQFAQFFND